MIRGLAGLVSTNGAPVDAGLLETMLAAMGTRSDRRHGLYVAPTAALALGGPIDGTWDLENPASPSLTIADLRLDNRSELSQLLNCRDSDDDVVAQAFRRWGVDCPEHLHGDFALACWNPQSNELFLARDRFGVRPLVYTMGEGWFAFASEAKALLALPDTCRDSSEMRIAEFLAGQMPQADTTMFDAIRRLPAGHRMTVRGGSLQSEAYWRWELPPPAASSNLKETLAEVFTLAVSRRVPEDGTAVVTLSGGLDSSSVAATMAKGRGIHDEPISTYSLVFDRYPDQSERSYIQRIIDSGGFKAHFLDLDIEDPFESFSDLLARQDGLFLTPGLAMGRSLLGEVKRGTVVLDGHGGDEVISDGYERLHELAERRQWFRFWIEAMGASRLTNAAPFEVLASYYALYGRGGRFVKKLIRKLQGSANAEIGRASVLNERLATRLEASTAAPSAAVPRPTARDRHMAVLVWPGQQHVLEVLDRDAAGRGHEARSPFWDEDLIAFMLSVPAQQKLRRGRTRWIMREAMADRLPDKIRWRRDKHDFNHHLVRGLRVSPAASAQRFDRAAGRLSQYMDLSAVSAARNRLLQTGTDAEGSDVNVLWRATAVAEWLEYADQNGIRVVE